MRFLADGACAGDAIAAPEPCVFSGLGDLCADIQECVRSVRKTLDVASLDMQMVDADENGEDIYTLEDDTPVGQPTRKSTLGKRRNTRRKSR